MTPTPKTTVIYHSGDFDGIFCGRIAKHFMPEANLIGWDFGDAPLDFPTVCGSPPGLIFVMDLPINRVFGWDKIEAIRDVIWIDHHRSAIETHPTDIPGFRLEGVAACRLAWAFMSPIDFRPDMGLWPANLPTLEDFRERVTAEPAAVRLAGEYDVHDLRDPNAEIFQCGLKSEPLTDSIWEQLFATSSGTLLRLLDHGRYVKFARDDEYAEVIRSQGFDLEYADVRFLACNSHELDIRSQLFAGAIGARHDALMGFTFSGRDWRVSMYHIDGRKQNPNILNIAVRNGGGGHPGACGFRCKVLPFSLLPS